MRRKLQSLFLILTFTFLALSALFSSEAVPTLDQQHRAAHHIISENILEGKGCSATAVGPHTLLTAGHCLVAASKIQVDDGAVNVLNLMFDDADHMLVVTDATFPYWLRIDQTALASIQPETAVHMWGNPGHTVDLFRTGVFSKWEDFDEENKVAVFLLPIYGGDSGAGILNDSGAIIAVVSMGDQSAETAVFILHFTSTQLGQIK